jgi:hypothetical protein
LAEAVIARQVPAVIGVPASSEKYDSLPSMASGSIWRKPRVGQTRGSAS